MQPKSKIKSNQKKESHGVLFTHVHHRHRWYLLSYHPVIFVSVFIYRVVQKTAQSLWHHNFATVHHRVVRFSAKCFENFFYMS